MSDIHSKVQNELISSGKYNEIYSLLERELTNSGWTEKFQNLTQQVIESSNDEELNFTNLINKVSQDGRDIVPDEVKMSVVKKIAEFLDSVVE